MKRIREFVLWAGLLSLAFLQVGCPPFYRDDELRALRAADTQRSDHLVSDAKGELAAGRSARAERLLSQSLETNPEQDAEGYLLLARAQRAAGHPAESRATARFALQRPEGSAGAYSDLRRLLVSAYADEKLIGRALDWLDPQTLAAAVAVPELASPLGLLAEAEQLAAAEPAQALAHYAEWLAAYGEPDHPLLRAARKRILDAAAPLTANFVEQGARLMRAADARGAIRHYALAYRYQTDETFAATASVFVQACASVATPEAESPLASSEARRGDAALAHEKLGEALLCYRRAVVAAPCWATAHRNLALLLFQAELRAEALRQMDWFIKLSATPTTVEQALRDGWSAPAHEPEPQDRQQAARRMLTAIHRRNVGIALLVLGGVAGGVAGLMGYLGSDVNHQIQAGNLATLDQLNGLHASGQRENQAAIGGAIVGGAFAVAGIPLLILGLRDSKTQLTIFPEAVAGRQP